MRHTSSETLAALLRYPVVPVFYHADAAYAQRIVRACYAGGIRVFEFVNRGEQALEVFTQLQQFVAAQCPDMMLGIGTIYKAAEAEQFIAAGAEFVVQPLATAEVAAVCRAHDVPWLPGALTPTEIYHASEQGAAVVKIFPGNVVGPKLRESPARPPAPHQADGDGGSGAYPRKPRRLVLGRAWMRWAWARSCSKTRMIPTPWPPA